MNEARRMRGREELATSSPPLLWGDEGKGRRWLSGQFAHAVASCPQPSQVLLALWTDEGNEIPRYRITVQRLYEFVLLVDISKLLTEKGIQLLGGGGSYKSEHQKLHHPPRGDTARSLHVPLTQRQMFFVQQVFLKHLF